VRSAQLPEGVETLIGEMAAHLTERRPDPMTAIVIVTRGHRADEEVLRAALETAAGYVGMIGSVSKVRAIFRHLLREGMTEETLSRVHAPIGLDLRAETPDEIALSIAAELLLWRRGGTGQALKESAGALKHVLAGMDAPDAKPDAEPAPEETPASIN
jgi:xanthine dehydrogenase accessory factor